MKNLIPAILLFISIRPFETDYCTMFFDGSWGSCCLEHDLRYWVGGTKEEQLKSDTELRSCVEQKSNFILASLMYYSVRGGHYSPVKHKYKWSWGFGDKEDFKPLTKEQKQTARDEIQATGEKLKLERKVIQRFVKEAL